MTTDGLSVADDPVSVFYSYAHEDGSLRDELEGHLKILERRGLVQGWHDRKIVSGRNWSAEIDRNLLEAELVLFLVSSDFVNSDYIIGRELKTTMDRHARGDCSVAWIKLREVDLQSDDVTHLPFLALQGLPTDLRPVMSWPNRDEAWTDVARGLRRTITEIRAGRAARPGAVRSRTGLDAEGDARGQELLNRVTDAFANYLESANRQKGGPPFESARTRIQAQRLIDETAQRRVLWVDDLPDNNRDESAALNHLQIEVLAARSTEEALKRLAEEEFDLVISDWNRTGEAPDAGLTLLHRMRASNHRQPIIFYHGAFEAAKRRARSRVARDAGALGEAVYPGELLSLVVDALSSR